MKNYLKILIASTFIFTTNHNLFGQKTDVDSLLTKASTDVKKGEYDSGLQKTKLGIKLAPDYLDFHLLQGRIYQLTQKNDSARYYFNYVIDKNPNYQDAFFYLINLNSNEQKYDEALVLCEKAIQKYPEEKTFYLKKMVVLQLQNDEKKEYQFLKDIQPKFSDDDEIKQRLFFLESKINSERIGVNYSFTTFSRDNYGPWHLGSVQYIRERSWGSLIGRINYADRFASGQSVANGLQYEAESYFFTGKMSYSYLGAAYSDDPVFPKLRLGYSYFQNFKKGWEADLGFRFTKAGDREFKTGVIGIGKYIGSYWFNFRTYFQNEKEDFYPAFTLTTRYYLDTRFDYLTVIAGYGTSPDERTTLGQFDQRVALDSYRIGGGYYRLFNNHYLVGIQGTYNYQEYAPNSKQNELELSLMLQYKF